MPSYVDLRAGQRISVLRGASGLGAAYSSTIRYVAPVSMRIDTPSREGALIEFEAGDEIMIMVDLQGRLYTFTSRVQQVQASADSVVIDRPSIVQQSERRQFFRLAVSIRPKYAAIVDGKGDERRRLEAIMLDLSGGGSQIRAKQRIDVGNRVHLVFPLEDEEVEADITAVTTSVSEAQAPWMYRANGRFVGLPRQLQEHFIRYIFRQQVAQLQRGVR